MVRPNDGQRTAGRCRENTKMDRRVKMETLGFKEILKFIRSHNRLLRMVDLAVGSILGMLMGTTLAVPIAFRLDRGALSRDLILLSGLCGIGRVAFFIYGTLALDRTRKLSSQYADRRCDPA